MTLQTARTMPILTEGSQSQATHWETPVEHGLRAGSIQINPPPLIFFFQIDGSFRVLDQIDKEQKIETEQA